jgi:hypothetical protein
MTGDPGSRGGMIPDLTPAEIARFYGKVHIGGCGLVWAGGDWNRHGYGRFTIYRRGKRVRILAHRLACKLANGEDPGDQVVRHQCDTPPCCTPACFLLGTQADNIHDAVSRGRTDTTGLAEFRHARRAAAEARVISGVKTCSRCRESKPLRLFAAGRGNVDGRAYWCKACTSAHQASRRRPGS